MSLLEDSRPTNPAKHFMQIKSGAVSYYDKELQENVPVTTPLEFIVLDQLATVKGWSNEDESGIWSNEVKNVGKEVLNVRTKNGMKASGLWKDIKADLVTDGAKFNAVIYLAARGRDGLEIQSLSLKGAALNAWIEFTKKNDVRKNKVVLADWKQEGKAVKYMVPVFEAVPFDNEELEEAKQCARELKAYHDEYFSYNPDAHNEKQVENKEAVVGSDVEDDEEEPIDLSKIPF